MAGRKYGLGKYGAGTYDLGGDEVGIPPWVPVDPPPDIWVPIVEQPPWCEVPPHSVSNPEIWAPVTIPSAPGKN